MNSWNFCSPTSKPEKLLEKLGEMEFRPASIDMRQETQFNISEKALNQAWCKTIFQEEMPFMDEAIDSLMQNLNQGKKPFHFLSFFWLNFLIQVRFKRVFAISSRNPGFTKAASANFSH